jgi:hypothetical protein
MFVCYAPGRTLRTTLYAAAASGSRRAKRHAAPSKRAADLEALAHAAAQVDERVELVLALAATAVAARQRATQRERDAARLAPEVARPPGGGRAAEPLAAEAEPTCSGRIAILLADRDPGAALAQSRMSATGQRGGPRSARHDRAPRQ